MSGWSPPTLSRKWLVGICLFYILLFGYALIFLQELLLGVVVGVLVGSLYILWRVLVAVEAIADALQRLAHQREQDG